MLHKMTEIEKLIVKAEELILRAQLLDDEVFVPPQPTPPKHILSTTKNKSKDTPTNPLEYRKGE